MHTAFGGTIKEWKQNLHKKALCSVCIMHRSKTKWNLYLMWLCFPNTVKVKANKMFIQHFSVKYIQAGRSSLQRPPVVIFKQWVVLAHKCIRESLNYMTSHDWRNSGPVGLVCDEMFSTDEIGSETWRLVHLRIKTRTQDVIHSFNTRQKAQTQKPRRMKTNCFQKTNLK